MILEKNEIIGLLVTGAFSLLFPPYITSGGAVFIGGLLGKWFGLFVIYLGMSFLFKKIFKKDKKNNYVWECNYCNKEFKTELEALRHEKKCKKR